MNRIAPGPSADSNTVGFSLAECSGRYQQTRYEVQRTCHMPSTCSQAQMFHGTGISTCAYTLNPRSFKPFMEDIYNCPMNPESYPTVDGWNPEKTSWYGESTIIYRVFIHLRWCRISSINSITRWNEVWTKTSPWDLSLWALQFDKIFSDYVDFFKWGTITISTTMPSLQRGSILTKKKGATTFQYAFYDPKRSLSPVSIDPPSRDRP